MKALSRPSRAGCRPCPFPARHRPRPSASPHPIRVSLFHNIGTAVANAANQAGLNATIQPATSPNQYIPFVALGAASSSVSGEPSGSHTTHSRAANGSKARESPDLRVVGLVMPLVESDLSCAPIPISTRSRTCAGFPMVDGYTAQQTILPAARWRCMPPSA